MKIKVLNIEPAGLVEDTRGALKDYRKTSSCLNFAIRAAAHYAKRHGQKYVVLSGNAYGYVIDRFPNTKFHVFLPQGKEWNGYIVNEYGKVYRALLN